MLVPRHIISRKTDEPTVTIEVPLRSWKLLEETIKEDEWSGAVDFKLRRSIEKAFETLNFRPYDGKERISGPKWAVDTILETLELDSRSIRFDKPLRTAIARALKTVRYVSPITKSRIISNPHSDIRELMMSFAETVKERAIDLDSYYQSGDWEGVKIIAETLLDEAKDAITETSIR